MGVVARLFDREPGRLEAFSAATVDLADQNNIRKLQVIKSRTTSDTTRAWEWYDGIPELHYGINHCAYVAGHAEFLPKQVSAGQKVKPETNKRLLSVYDEIWSPHGGTRGLIEQFFRLMKLKGHAHLLHIPDGGYDFVSDDELTFDENRIRRFTLPLTSGMSSAERDSFAIDILPGDYLGRVWRPHPRWLEIPDSPMKSLDPICEQLDLMTKGVRARLMSRIAMAGILFVPSEISEVIATPSIASTVFSRDKVIQSIVGAYMANVENHTDAIATMPFILRGPAILAEAIRFITTDRDIVEMDMKLRDEAANRMLQGLDIQPSVVQGNGDSNHWSAWADRDEELRSQISPDLEMLCFALDVLLINPLAEQRRVPQGVIDASRCTFDLSGATARPNLAEDSRQAYDRFSVGAEGVRKMSGISDEFAPDEQEYVRMVGVKAADPYLATFGLPVAEKIDWDKVVALRPKPGPEAVSPGGKPKAGPGVGSPGAPGKGESDAPKSKRPA